RQVWLNSRTRSWQQEAFAVKFSKVLKWRQIKAFQPSYAVVVLDDTSFIILQ
ncbi:unnamed protein product, partial [Sphenostylis stenocarpa]